MKIYAITNHLTGKQYVGCTTQMLSRRFQGHCASTHTGIGRALRAEGSDNFTIHLLEEFEGDVDTGREGYWIEQLNTMAPAGYNLAVMTTGSYPRQKKGRPAYLPGTEKKKNRAISLTDDEFEFIKQVARQAGFSSLSAYLVHEFNLNQAA